MSIAILAALLMIGAVAQPSVRVVVDSTTVATGEPFAVRVTASGERVSRPVIPHVEDLVINRTPSGTSQSMQIQFINGRAVTNQVHEWVYYATAKREGAITLPPISVRIDGKDYFSEEIQLTAQEPAPPQVVTPPPAPGRPQRGAAPSPPDGQKEITWDDVVLVECTVDKRRAYQGEPIQLTLSIWELQYWGLTIRYTGPRSFDMPKSEGFYALPPEQRRRVASRNRFDYEVQEFTQRLYPMRAGMLDISTWSWQGMATVMAQFGPKTHSYRLTTQPVTIEVLPLPASPPGFTGAVGRFRVQAQVSARDTEQGVPVELLLRVSGEGNPDAIGAPQLPALSWAHVSGQLSQVEPDPAGAAGFTKVFRYTLSPHEIGEHAIPPIPFCYFDPASERYRTEETRPIALRVAPPREGVYASADHPAAPQYRADIEEDIWSVKPVAGRLRIRGGSVALPTTVVVSPPLLWGGFFLFMRRRRRLLTDPEYARKYYARSRGHKRLARVAASPEPVEELYRALIEFLADACNVNAAGLTSEDVRGLLEGRGLRDEAAENLVKILRACERDRYAAAKLSPAEMDALTRAAVSCVDRLEEALLKGRAS